MPLLRRALILFMKALSSWPHYLPKALPPNIITLRVRILMHKFWGDTNIQFITVDDTIVILQARKLGLSLKGYAVRRM